MGILKGFKDMKSMVNAAPGLLEQTAQLSANAQAMQAQAAQGTMPGAMPAASVEALPAELSAPIAGVDLASFAQVSADLAQYGYDQTKAVGLAAVRGIDAASWQTAMDGWNARIAANPAVARQFNAHYTGRA